MYRPRLFDVPDAGEALGLARSIGFGTLVSTTPDGLEATHMPFVVDPGGRTLRGHFARANGHWQHLAASPDVLVIFQGPHAYVSPDWYESPHQVPTWNYVAAHVSGRARAVEEADWLRAMLVDLSAAYESAREKPWTLDKMPDGMADRMAKAIVGVEIEVVRVEGKRKLSQNKNAADRAGVVRGLRAESGAAGADIADLMQAALETEAVDG